MNRLTQYIYRQGIMLALSVSLALVGAFWLVQSLRIIQLAVDRGIGISLFLELMVLSLPQLVQLVAPVACFIGVLFTYNKLITDSELVVMRACGSSQWDLARPALVVAGTGTAIMLALAIYFLPASKNAFKDLQFQIRNQFNSGLLQEGAFTSLSDRLTVYVRSRSAEKIEGLLLQDNRDPDKPSTFTAQSGLIAQIDGHPAIVMVNGTKEVWDKQKKQLSFLTFDRYSLDLDQFRDAPGSRILEPDERYLSDLFFPADTAGDVRFANRLKVEGHSRLVDPLFCFSFISVALACLLTGELDRRGQTRRMLSAFGIVIMLQVGALGIANYAARGPGGVILMYLNAILPVAVGLGFVLYSHDLPFNLRRSPAKAAS